MTVSERIDAALFRCFFLFLLVLGSATSQAAKRFALLIGNQDYKRGVGRLVNPLNDIRIVGAALRKVDFEILKPVRNGTRADILDAIERYTRRLNKAGPDAIGFIYYSVYAVSNHETLEQFFERRIFGSS